MTTNIEPKPDQKSTNNHNRAQQQRDRLFAEPLDKIADFRFDQAVVDVFPDMIKRSVPGYTTIVHMIGQLAQRYCRSGTRCYDLGCSLGAATLAMRHRVSSADCEIIAIDNSADMVRRARQVVDADSADVPVKVEQNDITSVHIENASVCVLNFTLQFIPLEKRSALLTRIFDGMVDGGILIISEKLKFNHQNHQELMTEFHHYFKKTNGYSDMEIAQKRNAIENVLVPETFDAHKDRLSAIGFHNTELWFQCFNFASFIAFKSL